jgi:hypothetical protein
VIVNVVERFRNAFPQAFLQQVSYGVSEGYHLAALDSEHLFSYAEERANVLPGIRRGRIEQMLHTVTVSFPALTESPVKTGFWFHREIRGGEFVFTQCGSSDPDSPLRSANYKEALAGGNIYLSLFPDLNVGQPDPDQARLFAVLLHGWVAGNRSRVDHAMIKFPKEKLEDGFYDGHIDLMAEFPEAFGYSVDDEVIEDLPPELNDQDQTGT